MRIRDFIEMEWYGIKTYGLSRKFSDWVKSGKKSVEDNPELANSPDYVAIIIAVNYSFLDIFQDSVFGEGVELLIHFFKERGLSYKVKICRAPKDAEEIIVDPNAKSLWIFGHGKKNNLAFGKNGRLKYKKFEGCPDKKTFIAQLHCNTGEGPSLLDVMSDGNGICGNYYRYSLQNRQEIQEWIARQGIAPDGGSKEESSR